MLPGAVFPGLMLLKKCHVIVKQSMTTFCQPQTRCKLVYGRVSAVKKPTQVVYSGLLLRSACWRLAEHQALGPPLHFGFISDNRMLSSVERFCAYRHVGYTLLSTVQLVQAKDCPLIFRATAHLHPR